MKPLMSMAPFLFCALVSGCTANDWIEIAGGVMQGRDDYNKSQRTARLKRANDAAERIKARK
ncbi:hypothetical protein ABEH27_04885 [Pseudomonas sp. P39-UII1]|uniref:hypothetical protein n=1 Tax=unclassified Pseudomonas TaxID=196821 RepID=UPI00320A94A5